MHNARYTLSLHANKYHNVTRNVKLNIKSLKRSNITSEAYSAIKKMILSGRLTPGTQVNIEKLSRLLGTSNTPVREAICRLERERWIETIAYRGAFVRLYDTTELIELYEIREFIELSSLQKYLKDISKEDIDNLEKANSKILASLEKKDSGEYLKADIEFHKCIVAITGNKRLIELFETLVEQGKCFALGHGPEVMEIREEEIKQHENLLAAIKNRKTPEAVKLMKNHIKKPVEKIKDSSK